ncbi:MAG: inositol monophosphatase [Deltaproteobacteria bacterium]|nr:MAG: inositol monophosphatase [Deltaproteobacteria bacterium]
MKQIAIQAAEAGGRVLLEKFGRQQQIDFKGEVDLVTDADRVAEKTIVDFLSGTFPRHDILAEEGAEIDNGSDYRWIIDPLDGTTNYAHGLPWWAVSIALTCQGEVVLGVIHVPCSGEMFVAEKGRGCTLNGRPVKVSATNRLDQALLATGFPYDRRTSEANNFDHFTRFQREARACRRAGSACLDLAYTACGRFDGYWEMKLKPWDVAAGLLMVAEAGGRVSDFAGGPTGIESREFLASNGLIHDQMIAVLRRGRRP